MRANTQFGSYAVVGLALLTGLEPWVVEYALTAVVWTSHLVYDIFLHDAVELARALARGDWWAA